jgi:hypothetical protein
MKMTRGKYRLPVTRVEAQGEERKEAGRCGQQWGVSGPGMLAEEILVGREGAGTV